MDRFGAGAAVGLSVIDTDMLDEITAVVSVPTRVIVPVDLHVVDRVGFAASGQGNKHE